jgi:hypothetical protein
MTEPFWLVVKNARRQAAEATTAVQAKRIEPIPGAMPGLS